MEIIFIILIVVLGFSYISYLHKEHLLKLEILLKARDLTEAKIYEKEKSEFVPLDESEELQDVIKDKSPGEIRSMFKPSSIAVADEQ